MTASALALAFVVYSCKGNLSEAEKLDLDKIPLQTVDDMFYSEEGMLETTIVSRQAKHDKTVGKELWSAFGKVVVKNIVKQETMETDTLYWDAEAKEIWTDCYVKMSSPSGHMQGYGMRSDEMARNAILLKPFDNEFIIDNDSTKVVIDSVNFIGPPLKK